MTQNLHDLFQVGSIPFRLSIVPTKCTHSVGLRSVHKWNSADFNENHMGSSQEWDNTGMSLCGECWKRNRWSSQVSSQVQSFASIIVLRLLWFCSRFNIFCTATTRLDDDAKARNALWKTISTFWGLCQHFLSFERGLLHFASMQAASSPRKQSILLILMGQ